MSEAIGCRLLGYGSAIRRSAIGAAIGERYRSVLPAGFRLRLSAGRLRVAETASQKQSQSRIASCRPFRARHTAR
jgi:hypothetical protein